MKRIFAIGLFLGFLAPAKGQDTLRIMSYNILHGATTHNDFNLDALAWTIRSHDPDLVALQEVDYKTKRSYSYDLPALLGQKTDMVPLFARAMYYDGGEYGEMILSKYTFVASENIALPHLPKSEPRAALSVVVETPKGNKVRFVGTHLDHQEEDTDRRMQADSLVARLKESPIPTILAGDLNDVTYSFTLKTLSQLFTKPDRFAARRPTWPSKAPRVTIDHILYDKAHHWEVVDYEVICDDYVSDHCALLTTLVLMP